MGLEQTSTQINGTEKSTHINTHTNSHPTFNKDVKKIQEEKNSFSINGICKAGNISIAE